ncbi:MAG: helix-turn-helix transcriptional regulator [bacterium]|nr:helix-turn-helix transcriptional regulator [bacterium]
MNQEKIGSLIKKIRKENNLTQQDFAKKYGVTYQAVSKWENGKNIPDIALLKEICSDYNIDINELLDNNYTVKKKNIPLLILIGILTITFITIFLLVTNKNESFHFKTLSSSCNNFTIKGTLAYNNNQSSIYISNIDYCGGDDKIKYKKIECILYEKEKDNVTKLIKKNTSKEDNITIEEYLKDFSFKINNYDRLCKTYSKNSLYLTIKATDNNDKVTTYDIPLTINDDCFNN